MTIDFPALPPVSMTHSDAGLIWRFDGEKWAAATVAADPVMPPTTLVVTTSTVLSDTFAGVVLVEQAAPVTVTLPPSPTVGQAVTVKDALGQAATYAITIAGLIEGVSGMTISFNYGWASLTWAGAGWVQV